MDVQACGTQEPIEPVITPELAPWLARAEPAPLLRATGLEWVAAGRGAAEQSFTCPPTLCEADGRASFGSIAIATDSTLSVAGASSWGGGAAMMTQALRIELLGALPSREVPLRIRGRTRTKDAASVLVEGDLATPDGRLFGQASLRGVIVSSGRARSRSGPTAPAETPPEEGDDRSPSAAAVVATPSTAPVKVPATAPVDEALGVEVAAGDGVGSVTCVPSEMLATGWQVLHGGVVALIAHRAAHHVIERSARGRHRSITLAIEYLRPVPCDGSPVSARAAVAASTRRYAALDVAVQLGDGRAAATVRVTEELLGDGDSG